MECVICGLPTKSTVYEPNLSQNVPLCDIHKRDFVQCEVCDEFYYAETVIDGKCENCRDSDY